MSDTIIVLIVSAALNGAVVWGVVSTKLDWMRRDIDDLEDRVAYLEGRR